MNCNIYQTEVCALSNSESKYRKRVDALTTLQYNTKGESKAPLLCLSVVDVLDC